MQDSFAEIYSAHAFHSDFTGGRASGTITVTDAAIKFEGGGSSVSLPLDGLKIQKGGAANRLVFFSHASFPHWSVYTSDEKILKHSVLKNNLELKRELSRINTKKHLGLAFGLSVLAVIVAVVVSLFLFKDQIINAVTIKIPYTWEQKIGEAIVSKMGLGQNFVDHADVRESLHLLTAPLSQSELLKNYEFKFFLSADDELNAYALPGGHIVINFGLIQAAQTPEEVLGVVAHEMAHVTERHVLRQAVSTLGIYILVQGFLGDVGGVAAVLANNGSYLMTQKFSRDYERRADDLGWHYLVSADIDPRGMIDFFDTMKEEQDKKLIGVDTETIEKTLSFLSTHPATTERIDELKKRYEAMDPQKKFFDFALDIQLIKDKLGAIVKNYK